MMSYCRWSSDDFWCDIYCYEAVGGGYLIHVAAKRVVGDIPKSSHLAKIETLEEFMAAHKAQMAFLANAERAPIGLPYDGQTFSYDSPEEAAQKLRELKGIGYHVPDYAIRTLEEDAKY